MKFIINLLQSKNWPIRWLVFNAEWFHGAWGLVPPKTLVTHAVSLLALLLIVFSLYWKMRSLYLGLFVGLINSLYLGTADAVQYCTADKSVCFTSTPTDSNMMFEVTTKCKISLSIQFMAHWHFSSWMGCPWLWFEYDAKQQHDCKWWIVFQGLLSKHLYIGSLDPKWPKANLWPSFQFGRSSHRGTVWVTDSSF